MNDTLRTIDERRSTRQYLDKEISKEHKDIILNAAINAPTAGNMLLYSIIDVTDQDKKEKLSVLCDNQPFIKNGSMVLVFVANSKKWYDVYNQVNEKELKPSLADFYLSMADAHIAAENAVIAAESLGIGSCYIGDIVENYEKLKELLNLPKYINPICMLVFGYKKDDKIAPKARRFSLGDVVFENEYNEKSFETFVNKFSYLENKEEQEKKSVQLVNATFRAKMSQEFFKEMNRSLRLMIEEYLDD